MAIRGRKPTPTALKVLEGNPGKRKLNTREPKPERKAPSCPKWLEPEAKKEWRRLAHTNTSVKEASGDSDQWYFSTETQESLVWLVSKLMDEYGIAEDHVIRHFDVTGKICPNPYVKNNRLRTSWTWDEFKAYLAQYTDYIKQNPSWEFAGIYADDGISGTNTKKRDEFNRLIDDCMAGKIDLVVTKSISRFARNTLDCLNYIRQLKDKNIAVFFEKEGINTLDAKGEVLLTIMASLAQQESQSLSQNVRIGLQYRYQQGKVQVCANRFLGYDKDEEGKLEINPEEAEVVRRIFREYLQGKSYFEIGRGLSADGIRTAAGSDFWLASTLRKILRNEKYIGDALLQKTVTTDFLTKKRVVNNGIVPQYYVEGSHEAIIPKDIFMMVQEEMGRRAHLETATGRRSVYSGKYALSSIVYCGHCGDVFQRTHWNCRGKKKVVWRCVSRLHKKDTEFICPARTVTEADLHEVVVRAVNEVFTRQEELLPPLRPSIARALKRNNNGPVAELDARIADLEQEILKRNRARQDYDDLGREVIRLREAKYQLQLEDAEKEGMRKKLTELEETMAEIGGQVTEYYDALVRRLIERITVHDDKYVVEFKSGIEIDVRL